jgi:hypothetical protein
MKKLLFLMLSCLALPLFGQPALPITSYDYALPANNVSPISIGMGGLNVTNASDFYANYSNPALIGDNEYSVLMASFRVRGDEDLDFWEASQFSNVLRPRQFKYISLLAKQTAWTYQPVAAVHIVDTPESGSGYRYYDYQLDKVQATIAGSDESWQPVRFGLSIKYLTGRLVYLLSSNTNSFIDDKVKGFSSDIGVTLKTGDFTFGLAAYDVFSRLYWENYDSVAIQRRIALGAQYGNEYLTVSAGLQGKMSQSTDTTYHLGFQYLWDWNSTDSTGEDVSQGITLRMGLYSHNFYGTENINYTMGGGYNYNIFRFDFSMNNKGMKLRDSEYLFSLGVGLP